jgi:hypothetical protein
MMLESHTQKLGTPLPPALFVFGKKKEDELSKVVLGSDALQTTSEGLKVTFQTYALSNYVYVDGGQDRGIIQSA